MLLLALSGFIHGDSRDFTEADLRNAFGETAMIIWLVLTGLLLAGFFTYKQVAHKFYAANRYKNVKTNIGLFTSFVYATVPALLSSYSTIFSKMVYVCEGSHWMGLTCVWLQG